MDDVGRVLQHQLGLAAGAEVLEKFGPFLHAHKFHRPFDASVHVAFIMKPCR